LTSLPNPNLQKDYTLRGGSNPGRENKLRVPLPEPTPTAGQAHGILRPNLAFRKHSTKEMDTMSISGEGNKEYHLSHWLESPGYVSISVMDGDYAQEMPKPGTSGKNPGGR
jgi:hypothetical protein